MSDTSNPPESPETKDQPPSDDDVRRVSEPTSQNWEERALAAEDIVRLAVQASKATAWGDEIMDMLFDAANAYFQDRSSSEPATVEMAREFVADHPELRSSPEPSVNRAVAAGWQTPENLVEILDGAIPSTCPTCGGDWYKDCPNCGGDSIEHVKFLWDAYVFEDDSNLTADAQGLKRALIEATTRSASDEYELKMAEATEDAYQEMLSEAKESSSEPDEHECPASCHDDELNLACCILCVRSASEPTLKEE